MNIRAAEAKDDDGLWRVLEPVIRAGETYPLPRDMTREAALAYWHSPEHHVYVANENGEILGTYYLRPNSRAGGGHVANCGYMTAPWARGRGVATALCVHSFDEAKRRGYRAMQFNLVIASNDAAMRLWPKLGMEIVGRLPGAFQHPRLGYVDAYVMYKTL
jgi:ribosomal protein S18 acetylase RimI-like enzyme